MEGQVAQAFAAVLSKDPAARKEAELFLAGLEGREGFWPALCRVATNPGTELWLAQSSVVLLKNSCKLWKDEKRAKRKLPPVPLSDKDFLKENILSCLSPELPAKVRAQFEEIAKSMAETLFPGQWDLSLPLQTALASSVHNSLYAGLSLLTQLSRVYEYSQSAKRKEIEPVVLYCFPKLLELLRVLLDRPESLALIGLILTSFWNFCYIELHESLTQSAILGLWLDCFRQIIDPNYGPSTAIPATDKEITELSETPLWTAKRLSTQIVLRLFQRTSNPTYVSNDVKPVAEFFLSTHSLPFLDAMLRITAQSRSVYVSPPVLSAALKYTSQACKVPLTFQAVQPVAFELCTNVLIPLTQRSPKDEELWREDAVEFVRREVAPEPLFSPVAAALHLLSSLCQHDSDLLVKVLQHLCSLLQGEATLLHKESAMRCIGNLREIMQENVSLVGQVETMLSGLIKPHLASPVGFLRARASWTYGQFAYYPMNDGEMQVEVTQTLCRQLVDPELPVKFQAALSLPKVLRWQAAKALISPELPKLLELYLSLIEEIDSEDLIIGLEGVINRFSTELIPHVTAIVVRLTANFLRIAKSPRNNEKTASDADMAAVSCLNTINKIVSVVQESEPSRLIALSVTLQPVLEHGLSAQGCEFFEETLDLVTCLLYFAPAGSLTHLVPLYRVLLGSALSSDSTVAYAQESISDLFSPLANFLGKYKPQMVENGFVPLTIEAIRQLFAGEKDIICAETQLAGKLTICLFENYKGLLDAYTAPLVGLATQLLAETKYARMKEMALEALGAALWYDCQLALPAIANSELVFQLWLRLAPKLNGDLARRHTALGFVALLKTLTTLSRATFPLLKATIGLAKSLETADSDEEAAVTEDPNEPEIEAGVEYDDGFEIWKPDDEDLYDSPAAQIDLKSELRSTISVLKGLHGFHEAAQQSLNSEEIAYLSQVVSER